ncbi:IclR family transcriptional regulator [Natranaeroarchaeum aerophilus]|uniref:IclR family transcriptional regulator n=1 Tax=Natranaeroarchaeum aerophilus TaxID=2917711 RepID=A0AAE3K5U8_9EURY|nr:IclR family transcriptional regulator [Natranaeroarchaeum aerophilus]MCL9814286.1 IclR family transcriptional regulator [Natranaeroarchaeum aerophilus]
MPTDSIPVQALATTAAVVETLDERDGAGVTEVARELDLTKSVVHNHLNSLVELGYVEKRGTTYRVGIGVAGLGLTARRRSPVFAAAREQLESLATTTGEVVTLVVEHEGRGLCLYATGHEAISDSPEGTRTPLHTTAPGKAILAEYSREEVGRIVEQHGLSGRTEYTITDSDALFDELRTVHDQDIAFERDEYADGRRGLGASIVDSTGTVLGAIGVHGPAESLSGKRLEEDLVGLVVSKAKAIELGLD